MAKKKDKEEDAESLEFDTTAFIEKKYGKVMETPTDTFTINMGVVNIIFNTNNV